MAQTTELPTKIKLDERFFPSNSNGEGVEITITALNNLVSSTYILPSKNALGVLTNDGNGSLSWDPPVSYVVEAIEKNDALTNGTFKIIQHGLGDSSLKFTAGIANYMIGYDQSDTFFKISKGESLGNGDIFVMNENNITLQKTASDAASMLTIRQVGSGDASLNFKTPTLNYSMGIDTSDLVFADSFKISKNHSLGSNDLFVINSDGVKMGPTANLLSISTTSFSVGPMTNVFSITPTETSLGPDSMITINATGVNLGPSNSLQTTSTHVNIAKNLILPNSIADGSEGIIYLGDCSIAHVNAINSTFFGELAGNYAATGTYNMAFGLYSGSSLTTGAYNVIIGPRAGEWLDSGVENVFVGFSAGDQNTNGSHNVIIGKESGYNNTNGSYNVYIGDQTGASGVSCVRNTFLGYQSGLYYSSNDNVSIGAYAGNGYTTALYNTIIGSWAGSGNASISEIDTSGNPVGSNCTYVGFGSGSANTNGTQNTFLGGFSGCCNLTGNSNEYMGFSAGKLNTNGSENVGLGSKALMTNNGGSGNVAIGTLALGLASYSDYNIGIGQYAGRNVDGSYNIIIGRNALGAATYKAPNNCILIGGNIAISDETISNRVCIGHASDCAVDNGFVLGNIDTMVGIRKTAPDQALDVDGNVQLTGQLVLVPRDTPPSPSIVGGLYFNSVEGKLKICVGPDTWVNV